MPLSSVYTKPALAPSAGLKVAHDLKFGLYDRQDHELGDPVERVQCVRVAAADPLNLAGILTPDPRIPAIPRRRVLAAQAS